MKYRQPGYRDSEYKEEREKRREEDHGPRPPREPRGMAREACVVTRCYQCGHQGPAPESVPTVYPLDASWATTDTELVVSSSHVSGEVEPALLFRSDRLDDVLVSVIVDFTDREEERRSIQRSKEWPKPLSERVWRYRDAEAIWDEIALRSWVEAGAERELYQSGKLGQLLAPPDLLARLNLRSGLEGTVLLMGTVPLRSKEFLFTDYFACELETPGHGKLSYECRLERQ